MPRFILFLFIAAWPVFASTLLRPCEEEASPTVQVTREGRLLAPESLSFEAKNAWVSMRLWQLFTLIEPGGSVSFKTFQKALRIYLRLERPISSKPALLQAYREIRQRFTALSEAPWAGIGKAPSDLAKLRSPLLELIVALKFDGPVRVSQRLSETLYKSRLPLKSQADDLRGVEIDITTFDGSLSSAPLLRLIEVKNNFRIENVAASATYPYFKKKYLQQARSRAALRSMLQRHNPNLRIVVSMVFRYRISPADIEELASEGVDEIFWLVD